MTAPREQRDPPDPNYHGFFIILGLALYAFTVLVLLWQIE